MAGCNRNPKLDNIVAQVGDRQIQLNDYVDRYSVFLKKTGVKDNLKVRQDFLKMLVNETVVLEYARLKKIDEEPAFQARLKNKCEQLYLDYYYENYIYPQLTVSESELREAFRRSKMRIHARHLYARTLEEAFAIRKELNEGRSFESLAREIFKDPTLAANGGDLGWFSYDEMDPNFEDAAYSMQVGEVSDPVKTSDGYSIIQVLDIEMNPFMKESDYAKNEKWLRLQVKRRKHTRFLETQTDAILDGLDLQFNQDCMERLIQQFPAIRAQILGKSDLMELNIGAPEMVLLNSKNGTWTLQKAVFKLAELNQKQWNRIRNDDDRVKAITGLVIREEIERQIEEKQISTQPEVIHLVNQKRDHVLLQYITENILDTLTISDAVLQEYFNEHRDEFVSPVKYEIAEIAVRDSAIAWHLTERLNSGASFAELAATYSQNERSADRGGYLGWGELDQFGKLAEYLKNSQIGDIVGPVTYYDQHIILKILDIRAPALLDFEDSKRIIEAKIKPEVFDNAYYKMMNEARTKIKIDIESVLIDKLNIDIKRGLS